MPKITLVTTNGDESYKDISANIPCHQVIITEDGSSLNELWVKFFYDDFTQVFKYKAGQPIPITGPGAQGILRRTAHYNAVNHPATAEVYCQIRTASGEATDLRVEEHERQLV